MIAQKPKIKVTPEKAVSARTAPGFETPFRPSQEFSILSGDPMRDFLVFEREFSGVTSLVARAGTNVPQGGDAGNGGMTIIEFKNKSGAFTFRSFSPYWIRITAQGDSETELIIEAIEWIAKTLREEIEIRK